MSEHLSNDTSAALARLQAILTRALAELDALLADPTRGEASIDTLTNSALPDAPIRAIPIPEWAGRARQLLPTDWPRVGGRAFVPEQTDLFRSEAFRDLWRPGETREIYAGACDGLLRLSRKLKAPTTRCRPPVPLASGREPSSCALIVTPPPGRSRRDLCWNWATRLRAT